MQEYLIYSAPAAGALALAFAFVKASSVNKQDQGDEKMKVIAKHIQDGAAAFLKAEYKVLAIFVAVVAVLLGVVNMTGETSSPLIAVSFILGAFASGLAGWIGMAVATKANVRTTAAARESLPKALAVAFNGGTVMGMTVVGLALVGLGGLYLVYTNIGLNADAGELTSMATVLNVLTGFSMGASSIALFARVGGGIYTKAADVGADLVGKVEENLEEDSPYNPAVIADNVGDNVGDVAGMGADLFELWAQSSVPWFWA